MTIGLAMRKNVFSGVFAAAVLGLSLGTPRAAAAYEFRNDTNDVVAINGTTILGIPATLGPGSSYGCNTTFCSVDGRSFLEVSTGNFTCKLRISPTGYAWIERIDRSELGLPDDFLCMSVDGNENTVPDNPYMRTYPRTLTPSTRDIRFLATGDPQYSNSNASNANANDTLANMRARLTSDKSLRGMVVAGDLTNNTRPEDEFEYYLDALGWAAPFTFDGLGNHDMYYADDWQQAACDYDDFLDPFYDLNDCVDRTVLWSNIRNRSRATQRTNVATAPLPHYSWDWQDAHFVQLNLYAGRDHEMVAPQNPAFEPMASLEFLEQDLESYVGNSRRPVVLIQHYGFDYLSADWWTDEQRAALWDVIARYNVVAILTGHLHLLSTDGAWRFPFDRPADRTKGPASIPTYNVSAALNGAFVEIQMTSDRFTAIRRNASGMEMSREEHYLSKSGFYENFALHKSASQSSTYVNGIYSGAASLAVDGKTDGNYLDNSVTHTLSTAQPSWEVDLGTPQDVGDVVLYNRTDCCSDRLSNFALEVTDSSNVKYTYPYSGAVGEMLRIKVNRKDISRVKVQLLGSGPLSLAEVHVFTNQVTFRAKHSGHYIDVLASYMNDGASVIQAAYRSTDSQRFEMLDVGNGYVKLVAHHSGKCLGIAGASMSPGAPVTQQTCVDGETSQQFRILDEDGGDTAIGGYKQIVSQSSGMCLDIKYGDTYTGTEVIQWPCAGSANQLFELSRNR
jgi:hypothetical protein